MWQYFILIQWGRFFDPKPVWQHGTSASCSNPSPLRPAGVVLWLGVSLKTWSDCSSRFVRKSPVRYELEHTALRDDKMDNWPKTAKISYKRWRNSEQW